MRAEEAAALQAKLQSAGKTAAAFEQRTAELFKSVGNLEKRRMELETDVKVRRARLATKDAEIVQIEGSLRSLKERVETKKSEAKEIFDKLRLVEKEFHTLLHKTKTVSSKSSFINNKIEQRLLSQDLAVQRGYSCTRNFRSSVLPDDVFAIFRDLIGNAHVHIADHRDEISDLTVFSHFALSPGPGSPADVGPLTRAVLEFAVREKRPLLGVCLGHQFIVQHFCGPTAVSHCPAGPKHGVVDKIEIPVSDIPLFRNFPPTFKAVRYHSLVCDSRKIESISDLRITAWSLSDSQVMAVQHTHLPIYGVQFHPESILTEYGNLLISNFMFPGQSLSPAPSDNHELPAPVQSLPTGDRPQQPDIGQAKQIFFKYIYDEIFPCVWIHNESKAYLAGGRLCQPRQGDDRKCLLAGFRSFEGEDEFLQFDKFIVWDGFGWQLVNSNGERQNLEVGETSDISAVPQRQDLSLDFVIFDSPAEYKDKIRQILEGPLLDGDSYEVCLTTRMEAETPNNFRSTHFAVQAWLAHLSEQPIADFSGLYLNYPSGHLVSFSPECFLSSVDKDYLRMRPIKGTRVRTSAECDAATVHELKTSEKDKRENLMIVDLVRNDFNKISRASVTRLFDIQILHHTIQMFSEVVAPVPAAGIAATVNALFPAGSMTGAPKIRTMEILRKLENRPRGVYSGICGLIQGDCVELGVVIRSVFIRKTGTIFLGAGGAIVHGSDTETEWSEALMKFGKPLGVLQRVCSQISLHNITESPIRLKSSGSMDSFVECLLVRKHAAQQIEIYNLNAHLQRMQQLTTPVQFDQRACEDFICTQLGTNCEFRYTDGLLAELTPSQRSNTEDYKLRILGTASSVVLTFELGRIHDVNGSSVALAPTGVFSFDKLLLRKFPISAKFAHLLWNERGEITEGSWFNVAFRRDGVWITPHVSCGLLPGIYRRLLLAHGKIVEGVVRVDTLQAGEEFICFNSVRGVWKAQVSLLGSLN